MEDACNSIKDEERFSVCVTTANRNPILLLVDLDALIFIRILAIVELIPT
tara:strand:- start:125 stop:274 length:150 start_codon:yes stop_codon:yes gene_type:complete